MDELRGCFIVGKQNFAFRQAAQAFWRGHSNLFAKMVPRPQYMGTAVVGQLSVFLYLSGQKWVAAYAAGDKVGTCLFRDQPRVDDVIALVRSRRLSTTLEMDADDDDTDVGDFDV